MYMYFVYQMTSTSTHWAGVAPSDLSYQSQVHSKRYLGKVRLMPYANLLTRFFRSSR